MYKHIKPYVRPSHYAGPDYFDYYPVAGRSRDSSIMEESNFDTILRQLGGEITADDDTPEVQIIRDHHWAVGWVETLYVHARRTDLLQLADRLRGEIADYPVLDEEDFSRREWESATQVWADMSVKERYQVIARFRYPSVSIFAARRGELPEGDHGGIFEYCRGE